MHRHLLFMFIIYCSCSLANENKDLLLASMRGELCAVKQLLANQANNIETFNNCGYTPLFMAVRFGHEKIVRQLLKQNARVDRFTLYGLDVYELFNKEVSPEAKYNITMMLLRAGADFEGHVDYIKSIINKDPNRYVAHYLTKLMKKTNTDIKSVIIAATNYWIKRADQNKLYRAKLSRITSLNLKEKISNEDKAQLLGCMARKIRYGQLDI